MSRRGSVLALSAVGIFWLSLRAVTPPAAVGPDADPERFSSGRAMEHVRVVAREPHPSETEEQQRVLDYLEGELRELGLEPLWQEGRWGGVSLQNLLARRPGTGPGGTRGQLAVVAHTDARWPAPGAGDDAAAVAAILEALRALGDEPLRNDLLVVLTDGEELGLLGAELFAAEHPWMAEIDLVLNYEGRGNAGPSILFESSPGNERLLQHYTRSVPHPFGTSIASAVYAQLNNDTDFTVFREAGKRGLNFAYVGGGSAYHAPIDTAANLDERSLQHHGANLLALLRSLGDAPLEELEGEADAVFFNAAGIGFVRYSAGFANGLVAFVAGAFGALLARSLLRRKLTPKGLLFGALAWPLVLALVALLVLSLWLGIDVTFKILTGHGHFNYGTGHGNRLSNRFLAVGAALLAPALTCLLLRLPGLRALRPRELAAAALAWALALLLFLHAEVAAASYALAWPLGAGVLALLFGEVGGEGEALPAVRFGFVLACTLTSAALLLPLYFLFNEVGSAYGSGAGILAGCLATLGVPLFSPGLTLFVGRPPARLAWGLAGSGVLLFLAVGFLEAGGR